MVLISISVVIDLAAPEDDNIFEYLGDATAERRNRWVHDDNT